MARKKSKKNKGKKASLPTSLNRAIPISQLENVPRLSKCAAEFACALEDPFNCSGLACVPDVPSTPSRKVIAFSKGTMTIGTGGFGFVLARTTGANDITAGWYSDATYTSTIGLTSSVAPGTNAFLHNGDYNAASIAATVGSIQWRTVGCGIRIRYTGTELNRSGFVAHLEEPDHVTTLGVSFASTIAYDKAFKSAVSRTWHSVCFHHITHVEMSYGSASGTTFTYPLLLNVQSLAGNTFDFEYFHVFEAIGSSVRGKTPSDCDIPGMNAVMNTVQSKPKDGYVGEINHETLITTVWNSLMKGISGITSLAYENRSTILNAALKAMSLV